MPPIRLLGPARPKVEDVPPFKLPGAATRPTPGAARHLWYRRPSALLEDTAPLARLAAPRAQLAPAPRSPTRPQQRGSSLWLPQPAPGRPKVEDVRLLPLGASRPRSRCSTPCSRMLIRPSNPGPADAEEARSASHCACAVDRDRARPADEQKDLSYVRTSDALPGAVAPSGAAVTAAVPATTYAAAPPPPRGGPPVCRLFPVGDAASASPSRYDAPLSGAAACW